MPEGLHAALALAPQREMLRVLRVPLALLLSLALRQHLAASLALQAPYARVHRLRSRLSRALKEPGILVHRLRRRGHLQQPPRSRRARLI